LSSPIQILETPVAERSFEALRNRDFRSYVSVSALSMMGDNIEHVISYWVIFQVFHSPALAGFAVVAHWLPYLLLSWYVGALTDRFDCRRLVQTAQGIYMFVSVVWAFLFINDGAGLEMWHAVVLLSLHGIAGALAEPGSQVILYNVVGTQGLQSAVRLTAIGRQLGIFLGPVVGGALLWVLGPTVGLIVNALVYLPMVIWLETVKHAGRQTHAAMPKVAWKDFVRLLRGGNRVMVAMITLTGLSALFVGNAFDAQMPEFAAGMDTASAGAAYGFLLAASGAGAMVGGLLLEATGALRPHPRTAVVLTLLWALSLATFAATRNYPAALALLFVAGLLRLSYVAMAQTLVQMLAPPGLRGRYLGIYAMAGQGLRTFSGVSVGFLGSLIGIHWSLGLSAGVLLAFMIPVWVMVGRAGHKETEVL